jgi:hypothetical protein
MGFRVAYLEVGRELSTAIGAASLIVAVTRAASNPPGVER